MCAQRLRRLYFVMVFYSWLKHYLSFSFLCVMILLHYPFSFPSNLIYVTENILITAEEERKIVKAFRAALVLKV